MSSVKFSLKVSFDELKGTSFKLYLLGHVSNLPNHPQSHDSQQTVLLEQYRASGDAAFVDLEGAFAIVILENGLLKAVTDRVASTKLYYHYDPAQNILFLATRLAEILRLGVRADFDPLGLYQFCAYSHLLGDRTILREVREVPPASILVLNEAGITASPYWKAIVRGYEKDSRTLEDVIDEFDKLWRREIERIASCADTFLIPLSGGLDSRLILGSLLELVHPEKILTYSFGDERSYDLLFGQRTAAELGVRNISVTPIVDRIDEQIGYALEELEGQVEILPHFPFVFSELIGNAPQNLVSGFIGDAIAGSKTKRKYLNKQATREEISHILHNDMLLLDDQWLLPILGLTREEIAPEKMHVPPSASDYVTDNMEHYLYENRVPKFTSNLIFVENDKFIYHSPFISRPIFDFSMSVPARYKADCFFYYEYIRRRHKHLASIPCKNWWGLPLNAGPRQTVCGKILRKARNTANRHTLARLGYNAFVDPNLNYVDFISLWRENSTMREVVDDALNGLEKRAFVGQEGLLNLRKAMARNGLKSLPMSFALSQLELIARYYSTQLNER